MQGIFQKENTDKALKYGIYRHLPTYEKIIRNLVSFYFKKQLFTTRILWKRFLLLKIHLMQWLWITVINTSEN